MKRSIKLGVGLCAGAVVIISFQNCSEGVFGNNIQFSSVAPPICRDMNAQEVVPKQLYSWDHKKDIEPNFNQVMAAPVVGDIDGDGIPEIAFSSYAGSAYTSTGILRVLNGKTGETKFSISEPSLRPHGTTTPLFVDIDRDGKAEVVYQGIKPAIPQTAETPASPEERNIIALNHDGTLRWKLNVSTGDCTGGFAAADLDTDGVADILADKYIISEKRDKTPYLKGTTEAALTGCVSFPIALGNTSKAPFNIVSKEGVHDVNGKFLWRYKNGGFPSVADLRKDIEGLEVVVVGGSRFAIYNGITGETIVEKNLSEHFPELHCSATTKAVGGGQATIGDFDGDPETSEIAIATGKSLTIFDAQGNKLAGSTTRDCSSLVTGLTSFDFNGDKKPEIVYADEQYLRIYEMNGSNDLKEVWRTINPSGTRFEYPVVADINGDGYAEIAVVANDMWAIGKLGYTTEEEKLAAGITGLRVFGPSTAGSWMPTRQIWNQFAYYSSNVNNNLTATSSSFVRGIASTLFRRNLQEGNQELECKK